MTDQHPHRRRLLYIALHDRAGLLFYGDSINEDIFMDKVGQISVKQIVRTAKERGGGSRGFAETMMLAYNSKNKYRLSMRKLYGKKSAKYESGDDDGDE